jgi:hypothetical protein
MYVGRSGWQYLILNRGIHHMAAKPTTIAEIRRMFPSIDDHKALEIMGLDPSSEELEVTLLYLADMTDVMGEERQPLSGNAARIYEIVMRDEVFEDDESSRR